MFGLPFGRRLKAAPIVILAFYSGRGAGAGALRALRRGGFRRSAGIYHAARDRVTVDDNDLSPRDGALLGGAVALGVLTAYLSAVMRPAWPASAAVGAGALVVLLGAALGWLAARLVDLGVNNRLLAHYRRLVLPDETLVLVQAPVHRVEGVLELLRRPALGEPAESAEPTTFVVREPYVPPQPVRDLPRRERFTADRLRLHATRLAAGHTVRPVARRIGRTHPLWGRLRESERTIRAIHAGLVEAARLEESVSLAAEWLLDNAYIIQQHIGDVHRNLSRRLYDALPLLDAPGGEPRIYRIAFELVARADGDVGAQDIANFLLAYQAVTPLTTAELWAAPLMLRLALIEHLSYLAIQIDRRQQAHERADLWANRLLTAGRRDPDLLLRVLAELAREYPQPRANFADRLVSQLQGEGFVLDPVRGWLERKLGATLPEVIQQEERRQAADRVTVANAITSLRRLAQLDWRDVFERVSPVERVLQADPAGVYARMDFGTRDRYRHAVEEVALRSRLPELEVAQRAVALARQGSRQGSHQGSGVRGQGSGETAAGGEAERESVGPGPWDLEPETRGHIGYFLVDAGRQELEAATGYRAPLHQRARRWGLRHPAVVYPGTIAAIAGAVCAGTLALAAGAAAPLPAAARGPTVVLLGLLAAFPATEVAVQVVNYLVTRLLEPRVLPKLSFEDGIPDAWRTLVVVPVLLFSRESIREDLERLEIRFLANQDPNLHYALLADLPDAPAAHLPEDAGLLEAAVQGLEQLNARYGHGPGGGPFSLFYRERVWSESEQAWMGWERKRGKLEELNRFLVARQAQGATDKGQEAALAEAHAGASGRGPQSAVPSTLRHVGDPTRLDGVQFVITLDADTQLPHDTARRMVATLAHPLNRPRLGPDGETVASGYTIVQPRVSTSLPSATATRFSRVFTDPVGTDPYTQAVSDVYQDLAGEGSYHGKGIYDLAMFHRVLAGRFPEALLLSHDLVEGAYVRVGLATDIELLDLFPSSYVAYASREHRWIRGDWQVADWCTPWVPAGPRFAAGSSGARGRRVRNPLAALNRWKIFDNLRRSLTPAAVVGLLTVGWLLVPRLAGLWTLLGGLALFLPPLLQFLDFVVGHPRTAIQALRTRHGWREVGTGWVRTLMVAAFLPLQAAVALDAIARVWYRRLVSRRHLLQWQTFQMALRTAAQHHRRMVWRMGAIAAAAGLVGAAIAVADASALPAAAPVLALWVLAPTLVTWLHADAPRAGAAGAVGAVGPDALPARDRVWLRRVARATWRYFTDFVGPESNWLPPDNYQEALQVEVAQRTSPTNIGLYLLSTVAAHDFGYVTIDEAIDRGLATLETVNKLERFEGHLLNWYRTDTLEPLPPRYVSTVDSGNLLASLWALSAAYREYLEAPVIGPRALEGLGDTLALLTEHREGPGGPAAPPGPAAPAGERAGALAEASGAGAPGAAKRAAGRADELIRELAALCADPPNHAGEIVRRLRAAAGPARELAALLKEAPAGYWACQVERQVAAWLDVVDRYLPWVEILQRLGAAVLPADTRPAAAWSLDGARQARQEWEEWLGPAWQMVQGPPAGAPAPSLRALAAGAYRPVEALLAGPQVGSNPANPGPPDAGTVGGELAAAAARARWLAGEALARGERLLAAAGDLADAMDMRFLYDSERRLFSIGYNVAERRLDSSYYDLLASEARLASFVAIARGDVPVEHWLALGRPFGALSGADGRRVLFSWSGTMFEYLMPLLLTRGFANSLLDEACRAALGAQIDYGARRGVPWGISEAAFSAVDAHRIYQYQAFGVPGLGLKRGLEEDLVVAPYAACLGLVVAPRAAVRNLRALAREGLRGHYGFYESIDYTRARLAQGQRGVVVQAYMAHHQGMSLLAIAHVLHGGALAAHFHADPRVRAAESLLYERIPVAPPLVVGEVRDEPPPRFAPVTTAAAASQFSGPDAPTPRTHLLSNGAYAVMVTSAGGGYSRWRDVAISRWRADTTLDGWGNFFYLKDLDQGTVWSSTHQPVRRPASRYLVEFPTDRAVFERRDAAIGTLTEVAVSAEDDVEVRRVTLVNHSSRSRRLEVTSYVELALAPPAADRAHPAFSKLFVQTEALADAGILLARRKPRGPSDPPVWAAHVVALPPGLDLAGTVAGYETDRSRFIGRGRSTENPAALEAELGGSAGHVLDPIFSLRCRLALDPGERVQLAFVTGAADTRDGALRLAEKYRDPRAADRAFELAWSHAQLQPRHLRVSTQHLQTYQQLASYMLYPSARLRATEQQLRANRLGQSRLWAYGVSGDLPIMVVTIGDQLDLEVVREALMAHTFWRLRGFKADLVILNEEAASYEQPLHETLRKLVQAHAQYTGVDVPGGIFLRPAAQMPAEDLALFHAAARVVVVASRGALVHQLAAIDVPPRWPPALALRRDGPGLGEEPSAPLPFMELPYFNGLGGFTPDGKEFAIYLGPGSQTPAPWVNVMANPHFGALVSEFGAGFAWYGNSQTNRLLPWSNDPVTDPVGDALYIRDEHTGVYWSPTPLPIRELDAYRARHGHGYTVFEHNSHAIEQELIVFVPIDERGGAPVRVQRLRLRNRSSRRRRLSVTAYAEWVLGGVREDTQQHVITSWDAENRALFARNAYHPDSGRRVAFMTCTPPPASYTADRTEFLGRNGTAARPAALGRQALGGRTGAALDPCAALQVLVEIDPGQEADVVVVLGEAADADEARWLAQRFHDPERVQQALTATSGWWDRRLGAVQVEVPDLAVTFLLNRWLLYQTLACRFWGRSAFYQSGGAFGFRDQVQDCMALVYAAPEVARAHLLEAAAHQFVEGDVQHWWHPPEGGGVRTRISDDLLWLPYAVAHYVRTTGDAQVLDEEVPFLEGPPLEPEEHEAYLVPARSEHRASLLEHCRRAIAKGLTAGPHGLPLIGGGDWNDGLNLVGVGGRGESVWLAWFLIDVLDSFAALCDARGDARQANEYSARARQLAAAVEAQAWDGGWYRRAYFDDGTPLGSSANEEARIDSLPQSWAVISAAADPARAELAMRAVDEHLVRDAEGLVLLFTPPFERSAPNPGYIQGYPPGVRENGGQYTHGALWVAMAHARLGNGARAVEILRVLNPVEHARTPEAVERYKVEPYAVAADVYALEGHVGRGGWTWYTGSSGWMYRVWLEEVLGFKLRGETLTLDPVLPPAWGRVAIRYRYGGTSYEITIENPTPAGETEVGEAGAAGTGRSREVAWIEVDGVRLPKGAIPLRDDGGRHTVTVRLGPLRRGWAAPRLRPVSRDDGAARRLSEAAG